MEPLNLVATARPGVGGMARRFDTLDADPHPHCMADCPPNAIHRGPDGEVFIDETCIGCGNCQRNCPYGVIRMDKVPPKKPN